MITITSPTSNPTYSTSTASLSLGGTASDAVGVTSVTWAYDRGGTGMATGTTSWTVGGITLQAGTNILIVTARDTAGNTQSDTLIVTYTPPPTSSLTVTIRYPTSDPTYQASTKSLIMMGKVSGGHDVKRLTWTNDRGGSGNASAGTSSGTTSMIYLEPGTNAITVTAIDMAGNTGRDTLVVNYGVPGKMPVASTDNKVR